MEKKETLLFNRQHTLVKGNLIKEFTLLVHQGFMQYRFKFDGKNRQPVIKAFRFSVAETWKRKDEIVFTDKHEFGYLSCRSGQVAHIIGLFERCDSIRRLETEVYKLKDEFRVDMRKDAVKEVMKQQGVYNGPSSPIVRSNKPYKPLPQIQLPWEK